MRVGRGLCWRWICVCGGFEGCRCEGGVWAVLCWVVLVVLEVVGVRVGLGLCWVGGFEVCQREGGVWVVLC